MSCRLTTLLLLLFLVNFTNSRSVPFLLGLELPEVDGSAVDTCRIYVDMTPEPIVTTPITTTTTTTTTPTPVTTTTTTTTTPTPVATTTTTTTTTITRKHVVATTKKPAVQSAPTKPEPKNSGAPVRPQPITDSLLYYILTNRRGFISQPMRTLPHSRSSDSDQSAAKLLKRAGRTDDNRRKTSSSSSEDSSDEF